MKQSEFYASIAEKTGASIKTIREVFHAVAPTVGEAFAEGNDVATPFGTLQYKERKATSGTSRNFQTGEQVEWKKPAHVGIRLKPSKALHEAIYREL